MLVTWGLGGGVVVDEVYYRGAGGRSGEIGFLPIDRDATSPRSLQDVVSLSALYEYLGERGYAISAPSDIDALQPEIRPVLETWAAAAAEHLLEPVIAVNCLLNPGAVLIGGRLPAAVADALTEKLDAKLRAYAVNIPALSPVKKAAIAEDAPAVGAAILPFSDMLFPTRTALLKSTG
jgi:predicted NBD/HSP70 family sugar kinase